jgi:hypothetical protein
MKDFPMNENPIIGTSPLVPAVPETCHIFSVTSVSPWLDKP